MSERFETISETDCPMSMNVQRLFDGELPDDQIQQTIEHLGSCAICADLQQSFESLSTLMGSVKGPSAAWQHDLSQSVPAAARTYDLRFVRRLTGIAAVLVAGLSAISFTIPESAVVDETSPYAAIDKLTQSTNLSGNEFASSFVKELSGTNQ